MHTLANGYPQIEYEQLKLIPEKSFDTGYIGDFKLKLLKKQMCV